MYGSDKVGIERAGSREQGAGSGAGRKGEKYRLVDSAIIYSPVKRGMNPRLGALRADHPEGRSNHGAPRLGISLRELKFACGRKDPKSCNRSLMFPAGDAECATLNDQEMEKTLHAVRCTRTGTEGCGPFPFPLSPIPFCHRCLLCSPSLLCPFCLPAKFALEENPTIRSYEVTRQFLEKLQST